MQDHAKDRILDLVYVANLDAHPGWRELVLTTVSPLPRRLNQIGDCCYYS